ncbi:MAG: DUF1080 domain-containing protein [Verrucomicrobia bacterium]|nr:DUF1080 domain-containing protein [Verrucomicrobiota bacterium]
MKKIFALVLSVFTFASTALAADGWTALFDGKTLNGWIQKGGKAKYSVEDGMIVGRCVPSTPNSFLCTEREFADFIIELDFKVDEALNSGVQLRSHCFDQPTEVEWKGKKIKVPADRVHGYQCEIDPAQHALYDKEPANLRADGQPVPPKTEPRRWTGGIYDEGRRGWLNDLTHNEPARKAFKPGEWNHLRIECRGDSLKTWLNGVAAADLKDGLTPKGFIALQVHGVGKKEETLEVRFKNIRLKEL